MNGPSAKRPEEPTFCIDEALGRHHVAAALRAAGHSIQLLTDHHHPGTKDPVWLPDICGRGWVILTKDKQMRRHPAEQLAIMRHGGRAFILTAGNIRGPDMGTAFLLAMPRIKKALEEHPEPFIGAVTRGGRVSIVYSRRKTDA